MFRSSPGCSDSQGWAARLRCLSVSDTFPCSWSVNVAAGEGRWSRDAVMYWRCHRFRQLHEGQEGHWQSGSRVNEKVKKKNNKLFWVLFKVGWHKGVIQRDCPFGSVLFQDNSFYSSRRRRRVWSPSETQILSTEIAGFNLTFKTWNYAFLCILAAAKKPTISKPSLSLLHRMSFKAKTFVLHGGTFPKTESTVRRCDWSCICFLFIEAKFIIPICQRAGVNYVHEVPEGEDSLRFRLIWGFPTSTSACKQAAEASPGCRKLLGLLG